MKKLYFFEIILLIITNSLAGNFTFIETARTYWIPWNTQHSLAWEQIELTDETVSLFRRNEYFDDIKTLIQRESHWITFCNLVRSCTGSSFIFPDLGFAIMDKDNDNLIGSVRFKLSNIKGCLSLGYGLIPNARNKKFGNEIIEKIIFLANQALNQPIPTLKTGVNKVTFMAEWHKQSNKINPCFDTLLTFIDQKATPFTGITASVDMKHSASLAIIIRNGMQPIEVECSRYFLKKNSTFFEINISCIYPKIQNQISAILTPLINNLLSRNEILIHGTENALADIFAIPKNWNYIAFNRNEKQQFRQEIQSMSTSLLSDFGKNKKINPRYYCPSCCIINKI